MVKSFRTFVLEKLAEPPPMSPIKWPSQHDIDRKEDRYHDLKAHVHPAIQHKGKVYVGQRGMDWHVDIARRHGLKLGDVQSGFHDPRDKKFYKQNVSWNLDKSDEIGLDSTEMMTPAQDKARVIRNLHKGKEIYENAEQLRARLVPAIRHKATGNVIKGQRGQWHGDLVPRGKPGARRDYVSGFHDPSTNRFLTRAEFPIDASELRPTSRTSEIIKMAHNGRSSRYGRTIYS